jgi:acyl-coenzyme A thioesterase PaaI-like protein
VTDSPADPADPVRASLGRQTFMTLLGARAAIVEPGRVVIELPARADLCQQNGFLPAGAVTSRWRSCRRR